MKKMMLVCLALICGNVWGANYYVDFSNGNDTQAGTSTAAAWKHAPGDPNATGLSTTAILAPGDTVIFKGGVQYSGTIYITRSGSSGSVITYNGNRSNTWGSGPAIIDGNGTINTLFNFSGAQSYIRITGFELRNTQAKPNTGRPI